MELVTHSPFLQALGYAIVNSLWQFALLWLIYVSLHTAFRLSSHQKYSMGMVIQFAGFVWFIITLLFYFRQCAALQDLQFADAPGSFFPVYGNHTLKEKFFTWILRTEQLLPYLSIAYIALLIFLSLRWWQVYSYTQNIRRNGLGKIDAEWRIFVQRLSAQLGIKKPVKIYLSELVQTPLTVGFFKPLILIPLASINHLNTEQMEAVILHELAHIRRFDYVFNLILAIIEMTLFFNPFTALISRHIKRERENCCDDWVLQYEYNVTSYARALLQIAAYQAPSAVLALKATDNKQVLLNRIKRMIEKKERTFFNYRHQLVALFIMTTVFSSVALLSPLDKITKRNAPPPRQPPVTPVLTAKAGNLFFNPITFLTKPAAQELIDQDDETNASPDEETNVEESVPLPPKRSRLPALPVIKATKPALVLNIESPAADRTIVLNSVRENKPLVFVNTNLNTRSIANSQRQVEQAMKLAGLAADKAVLKDKALQDLAFALDELKTLKLQLEMNDVDANMTSDVVTAINNGVSAMPVTVTYNKNNFRLLLSLIKTQLVKVKEQYTRLSQNTDEDFNVSDDDNCPVLPPQETTSGFSFEYNNRPVTAATLPRPGIRRHEKNRTTVTEAAAPALPEPAAPLTPVNKLVRKNYYTIKI